MHVMSLAPTWSAVSAAARAALSSSASASGATARSAQGRPSTMASASATTDCMARRASTGYLPAAVSPLSMTASVPSRTAAATSVTSARVGRGFFIIESSICVATMTGLPTALQAATIIFCAAKTLGKSISTPRSPRATMMPSDAARISSKFSTPSWFSIFETMSGMASPPAATWHRSSHARQERTLAAERTKESATKSAPASTAHLRSSLSLGVRAGRSRMEPGRFTPLRGLMGPAFSATAVTEAGPTSTTRSAMRPSSSRMVLPADTVVGSAS
mmetsp:Transcript_8097/g.24217  ORF Transcript_8097/g.24217 Transcript_8097/m.24217 type:complete len:275 (-) Transcript_8097:640-1464(-)